MHEIARLGGSVVIVARSREPLEATAEEARALARQPGQFVETIACDARDEQTLRPAFESLVSQYRAPDYLFNLVGYAYPQNILDLTLPDFRENMDANYYGQLVPILVLLPHLVAARRGHIANVSSGSGLIGTMGYATYAPTKFAIVGLSQCLRNELKPYNIKVSVLYPPDTDTPGFEIENRTKPPALSIMSQRVGLMQPDVVARAFVRGVLRGDFNILPGETRKLWYAVRLVPSLVNWIADRDYRLALDKVKSSSTGM